MKFKIGNIVYNLGFLMGLNDEEWRLRFGADERLVLMTPEEQDELGDHGEPTGKKVPVWTDALVIAEGNDAGKLWEALGRVLASEKVCIDVDEFLLHVEEHDAAVSAGRRLGREEQRINRLLAEERLRETEGLTLDQIQRKQVAQMSPAPRGRMIEMPPPGGGFGGTN